MCCLLLVSFLQQCSGCSFGLIPDGQMGVGDHELAGIFALCAAFSIFHPRVILEFPHAIILHHSGMLKSLWKMYSRQFHLSSEMEQYKARSYYLLAISLVAQEYYFLLWSLIKHNYNNIIMFSFKPYLLHLILTLLHTSTLRKSRQIASYYIPRLILYI